MYILYHLGGKTTILKLTRSWTENDSLLWNNNLIDGKLAVLCQILLFVDVLCLMYVCVTHCQDQTVVTFSASDVLGQREVTGTLEYPLCVTRPVSVGGGGHSVLLTAKSANILRTL